MSSAADDQVGRNFQAAEERRKKNAEAEQARKRGEVPDNVTRLPLPKPAAEDAPGIPIVDGPASDASPKKKKAKKLIFAGVLEKRVTPGRYIVALAGHRTLTGWGRESVLLAFKIIDFPLLDDPNNADRQRRIDERRRELAPALGVHVPRFVNLPDKKSPRPSLRSTFAKDWQHITGRRAPRDLARYTPLVLYSNCTLEVEVVDVVKDSDGRRLHPDDVYSVIRKVVRLCDGSPPCMREKKT